MNVSTDSVPVMPSQPGMFRRSFKCGHPDEFIEVREDSNGDQIHNLIKFEVSKECSRRFGNLPTYIQARCLNCAKEAKGKDDNNTLMRPKSLGMYQAVVKSTMKLESETSSLSGSDRALKRHSRRNDRSTGAQPHPRVSEHEHQAHRLETQAKAVACAGQWLAVPAKRVCNVKIKSNAASRPASRRHARYRTNNVEQINEFTEPDQHANEDDIEDTKDTLLAKIFKGDDDSFRVAAAKTISLSESKLERKRSEATAKSENFSLTATKTDSAFFDSATKAHRPQRSSDVISPGRESRVKEHLIDQFKSPLDALSKLILKDQTFQYAQPAPSTQSTSASPKKSIQEFTKRRNSTSTKRSTRPETMSMNFRKLSIDVSSAMSIEKTEPDSDSPDWACETSLAIESGRRSMEGVCREYHELKRLSLKAISGPGKKRNTCPSPFVDRSPASTRYGRHSEGAPQALRASAARNPGNLAGLEIVSMEKEYPRRHNARVAPVVDLNKTLPSLPSQGSTD